MSIVPKKNKFPTRGRKRVLQDNAEPKYEKQPENNETSDEQEASSKVLMTILFLFSVPLLLSFLLGGVSFLFSSFFEYDWYKMEYVFKFKSYDFKFALLQLFISGVGLFFITLLLMCWFCPNNKFVKKIINKYDRKLEAKEGKPVAQEERKYFAFYVDFIIGFVFILVLLTSTLSKALVALLIFLILRKALIEMTISEFENRDS